MIPALRRSFATAPFEAGAFSKKLHDVTKVRFPTHPLSHLVTKENVRGVMGRYFAMSQAFPFIQAGAYKDIALRAIAQGRSLTEAEEKTFVVGSFLCWDEVGGNYHISTNGIKALPEVLETRKHFHANLLREDLKVMFNAMPKPVYDEATKKYLRGLLKELGSASKVERVASMVAFEMHAESMITALWGSLEKILDIPKEKLTYFHIHVGGEDPAEPYHVAMTQRLVQDLIEPRDDQTFMEHFGRSYSSNIEWCKAICQHE